MLGGETQFRALVTGVSGQDGWYLAQRLLTEGCEVHGVVRDASDVAALEAELPGLVTHVADLVDDPALRGAVDAAEPDRIFNLAGSTSVARSWEEPVLAADVIGIGAVRLLNAAWDLQVRSGRPIRFLQASSAEVFGDPVSVPQDEDTAHAPVTPYGAAKDFAHTMVQVYRRRGMFASAAILYNHESPRRPRRSWPARSPGRWPRSPAARRTSSCSATSTCSATGATPPTTSTACCGSSRRSGAGDFVVATGEARSVRDFVAAAFAAVGVTDWEPHVEIDPGLYRPADPRALVGEAARLRSLGWRPEVGFEELVSIMVRADLGRARPHVTRPPQRGDPACLSPRTPSVLVVVPTLGERIETLEESLASVRAQQGVDAHLVVVVPDAAVEARDIAVRHGATLVSDPRRGLSAAVNVGIAARRGEEFYAWLVTTTCSSRTGWRRWPALLTADPSAVVAYGACPYIDDRGRTVTVSRAGDLASKILGWGPDLVPQPASLTRIEPLVAAGSTTSRCGSRWTSTCSCASSGWAGSSPPSRTSRPSAGTRTRSRWPTGGCRWPSRRR